MFKLLKKLLKRTCKHELAAGFVATRYFSNGTVEKEHNVYCLKCNFNTTLTRNQSIKTLGYDPAKDKLV